MHRTTTAPPPLQRHLGENSASRPPLAHSVRWRTWSNWSVVMGQHPTSRPRSKWGECQRRTTHAHATHMRRQLSPPRPPSGQKTQGPWRETKAPGRQPIRDWRSPPLCNKAMQEGRGGATGACLINAANMSSRGTLNAPPIR